MDEREREILLAKLRETREVFVAEVRGISERQARWKPTPEAWSILECAEHVAVAEQRMFGLLSKKATPLPDGVARAGREDEILAHGTDRTKKFKAPEGATPNGHFNTLADALEAFEAARSETIAYIECCVEDLRSRETVHAAFGPITAQECLALLTIHPARHSLQVREIRQHSEFPL
jgi:hypothetical protein